MLTSDLARVRTRRGELIPRWVDRDDEKTLALAARLVEVFEQSRGLTRGGIEDRLDGLLGTGTAYLLHRGLAKLLYDRCEFETGSTVEPATLRRRVFEVAAARHATVEIGSFDRDAVIEEVARELDLDATQVEGGLYADLSREQVLTTFRALSADRLLDRYNVALAQVVLLRATELEVDVGEHPPARYRELFRSIKFHRLLHRVESLEGGGYRIRLDGPFSLFTSSQRYGLQMASFLPTLLHLEDWTLRARVLWGKRREERVFRLDASAGLRSHTLLRGQWLPEEVRWLEPRFRKLESDWDIDEGGDLIDLGGRGVLVPDYVFRHRTSGRRVPMEILGFWRRGAVASRLELLRHHGPPDLILALSRELKVDDEELEGLPGEVYVFRRQPIAREVLDALRRFE